MDHQPTLEGMKSDILLWFLKDLNHIESCTTKRCQKCRDIKTSCLECGETDLSRSRAEALLEALNEQNMRNKPK